MSRFSLRQFVFEQHCVPWKVRLAVRRLLPWQWRRTLRHGRVNLNTPQSMDERYAGLGDDFRSMENLYARILPLVPPTGRLLDVGCGIGVLLRRVREHRPALDLQGADFSLVAVQRTQAYGFPARVAVLPHVPCGDAEFDCVVSTEVLEHLDDPAAAVRTFARILRPGGTLIVSVPKDMGPDHCDEHVQDFTADSLECLLRGNGFTVRSIEEIVREPQRCDAKSFLAVAMAGGEPFSPGGEDVPSEVEGQMRGGREAGEESHAKAQRRKGGEELESNPLVPCAYCLVPSYTRDYYAGRSRHPMWRVEADLYRALAGGCARGTVVDLGCGCGTLLAELSPARGIGIDANPQALDLARSLHPRLEFRVGDAGQPDLPAGSVDCVTAMHVLEHLDDPAAAMRAWGRLLKPGGRLILTTPNAAFSHPEEFNDPDHRRLLHGPELRELAMGAGLRVRKCFSVGAWGVRKCPLLWRFQGPFNRLRLPPLPGLRWRGQSLVLCAELATASRESKRHGCHGCAVRSRAAGKDTAADGAAVAPCIPCIPARPKGSTGTDAGSEGGR